MSLDAHDFLPLLSLRIKLPQNLTCIELMYICIYESISDEFNKTLGSKKAVVTMQEEFSYGCA